ncbi:MAG: hypothetical protein JNL11_00805 [Bdellovibrionaceae bacterium]|nr:hypothetical protein [Pseudobdellovibrionaceae bacterium]
MLKYIVALIFLIAAAFGLKLIRSSDSVKDIKPTVTETDSKNQSPQSENSLKYEQPILNQAIAGFKIERVGAELVVTPKSGAAFLFKDESGDTYIENFIVDYRTNPDVLSVYSKNNDDFWFTYLLPNGTKIPASHLLYFSPSGQRAIQTNFSTQDQPHNFNGWLMVEKNDDSFKVIAQQTPAEFKRFLNIGVQFKKWDGDDVVEVVIKYSTTQKAEFVTLCVPGRIEKIDGKWEITAELESAEQDCSEFNKDSIPENLRNLIN